MAANTNRVERQWVKILTVDPASRRVEGILKDFAVIQISINEVPVAFRWPKEGEWWLIVRENYDWFLRAPRQQLDTESPIEDLNPGDTQLGLSGAKISLHGDIHVNDESLAMKHVAGTGFSDNTVPVWDADTNTWLAIAVTPFIQTVLNDADASTALATLGAAPVVPPVVTSLPGSPVDGQEVRYRFADIAGTFRVWHLKYDAAVTTAYKWQPMGAVPLYAEVTPNETRTAGTTTYGALTTPGPAISLPLVGDYMVEIGARMWSVTNGNIDIWMSYDIGATAAVDADGIDAFNPTINQAHHNMRARIKTNLAAISLVAKYRQSGDGATFNSRWIRATPLRVG